jgi:hypothetical protein
MIGTRHKTNNTPIPRSGMKVTKVAPRRGAMIRSPMGDIFRYLMPALPGSMPCLRKITLRPSTGFQYDPFATACKPL